jgi:hypothetical protein
MKRSRIVRVLFAWICCSMATTQLLADDSIPNYAGLDNTLTCSSGPNDTEDEIRQGHIEVMKRGLFPYAVKTPIADYIYLSFRQKLEPTVVKDPWN